MNQGRPRTADPERGTLALLRPRLSLPWARWFLCNGKQGKEPPAKYAEFCFDQQTHSVNLWDKGRRTDTYRGKHRILGENLNLLHQLI